MSRRILQSAETVLADSNATLPELHASIGEVQEAIGHLRCRCDAEPELVPLLVDLEQCLSDLETKYSEKYADALAKF